MLKKILMSNDPVGEIRAMSHDDLFKVEPAIANLKMEIPHGYHHKDNLEHSIRVLANAIALEDNPNLVLRTSALLHDIGKPSTRKFEGNGKVTFRLHENVGARMAPKILKNHGYNGEEINTVACSQ